MLESKPHGINKAAGGKKGGQEEPYYNQIKNMIIIYSLGQQKSRQKSDPNIIN